MKTLLKECLDKIKPYLRDILIDLQNSDRWKIQLTIAKNSSYSNDTEEECVMHVRSNNVKFKSWYK